MRVGINPGIPALPAEHGELSGDPARFGSSDILSFSPLRTAAPGTFYLVGDAGQAGQTAGRHGNSQRRTAATAMKRATSATTTSRAAII